MRTAEYLRRRYVWRPDDVGHGDRPRPVSVTAADDHWKRQPRDPGGEGGGRWVDTPGGTVTNSPAVTPAVIYKKHPDGTVVATSATGDRRLRWDAGRAEIGRASCRERV